MQKDYFSLIMISMNKLANLKNKKITVMGLGLNRGGLGVTKFLAEAGAEVLVTDLKTERELQKSLGELKQYNNINYVLGRHRIEDFIGRDMIIQNPGVPQNSKYLQIARENSIPIETDLSLFLRICPSQNLIAVGGTKGKSTVTDLIYHIFCHAGKDTVHAGNIGISVFDVLPEIKPETLVLLEISSWQLEGIQQIQFKPHVAVLTNILPDHLDRYDSFDDYICSEKLICRNLDKSDYLVTNYDNPVTEKLIHEASAEILWFSTKKMVSRGSYLKDGRLFFRFRNKPIEFGRVDDIPIPGEHNISNVLAAANVAYIMNLPSDKINKGIQTFTGIPDRLEKIRTLNNISFYNDTCATTPEATIAAIQSFPGKPIILILGGKDKKLKYSHLCRAIKNSNNIDQLVVLRHPEYDASELILKYLHELGLANKLRTCNSLSDAVRIAYQKAVPETNILLSPSATSFGMFQNEFDRGNSFRQVVEKLS
jgi:UDP-N-acetylmuramoylalanine--D-glutamate ligase